MLLKQDGTRAALPLDKAKRFEVYRTRDIAIRQEATASASRKTARRRSKARPKARALNNGDIFTVEGFTKEGDIRLENGKLLPKSFGHFSLGYVDTSYASQGKTVDRVFIAAGNESLPASNQQQWYVSTTRGREMAKIYVEDKQEVRDAIARTGQRLSAVELTHTKVRQSTWRERFAKAFERHRVTRFLKARAASIADSLRSRGQEGMSYV